MWGDKDDAQNDDSGFDSSRRDTDAAASVEGRGSMFSEGDSRCASGHSSIYDDAAGTGYERSRQSRRTRRRRLRQEQSRRRRRSPEVRVIEIPFAMCRLNVMKTASETLNIDENAAIDEDVRVHLDKFIELRKEILHDMQSNLKKLDTIASKLAVMERVKKIEQDSSSNKVQLYHELKYAWMEISASIGLTADTLRDQVRKFKAEWRQKTLTDTQMVMIVAQMEKLKEWMREDRLTLNVIDANISSLSSRNPKNEISVSRFKVGSFSSKDTNMVRNRLTAFRSSREPRVRHSDYRLAHDTLPINVYMCAFEYKPGFGRR